MSNKVVWGSSTWVLFHTIADMMTDEIFNNEKDNVVSLIKTICSILPCSDCSNHATKYLNTINFKNIKNSEDLKKFFLLFHNSVNIRINKRIFTTEELNEKYKNHDLANIILHFMNVFFVSYYNERMIMYNFNKKSKKNQVYSYLKLINNKLVSARH